MEEIQLQWKEEYCIFLEGGILYILVQIIRKGWGFDFKVGVCYDTGKVGWMTILVWCCYPIVWLFSEGFASFSVSFEITMYAILDVINKVTNLASHTFHSHHSLVFPQQVASVCTQDATHARVVDGGVYGSG